MKKDISIDEMKKVATSIRRNIVSMIANANSGHPGGSLSATDILTVLYFGVMRHNPQEPEWPDRDRFVLSKGHVAPGLYSVLAECGYFPVEELMTFRKIDSRLQGHAHHTVTGVEMSAGSLGQGLSFSVGCALTGKLNNQDFRVYTLLGDGECDEGQVWEAAMAAPHFKLDNLCAIVDRNRMQIDGETSDIMELEPFADKWRAFGWNVIEVDGHDYTQLLDAFKKAAETKKQPTVLIARTIKGKGVSFMENVVDFHGKAPNAEQLEQALKELV